MTLKIKLISTTTKPSDTFNYRLPPPPPNEEEIKRSLDNEDVTILSITLRIQLHPNHSNIYEKFTEKGIDWCRYCGVAGKLERFGNSVHGAIEASVINMDVNFRMWFRSCHTYTIGFN